MRNPGLISLSNSPNYDDVKFRVEDEMKRATDVVLFLLFSMFFIERNSIRDIIKGRKLN